MSEWDIPEDVMPAEVELAFQQFVALGPDRSLPDLLSFYKENRDIAPTTDMETLRFWSSRFNWTAKAKLVDRQVYAATQASMVSRQIDYRLERLTDAQKARDLGRKLLDATNEAVADALSSPQKIGLSTLLSNVMNAMKLLEWAGKVDREDGEATRALQAGEVLKMMENTLPEGLYREFQNSVDALINSDS